MRRRTLIGTIGLLGLAALVGLFAALWSTFSPQDAVSAQANNPPAFASDETTRTVDENTPWLQNIVGPVTATDADDDPLTYSLENAGASHFTIVSSTGQLQTGGHLDFEDQSVYAVKVIATDPSGASDKITVTIDVNDVDEPGTVALSWKQPQVDTELAATPDRPGRRHFRPDLAVVPVQLQKRHPYPYRHSHISQLHAGCRRREQIPVGYSLL